MPSALLVILSWIGPWVDKSVTGSRVSIGLLTVLTVVTQVSTSPFTLVHWCPWFSRTKSYFAFPVVWCENYLARLKLMKLRRPLYVMTHKNCNDSSATCNVYVNIKTVITRKVFFLKKSACSTHPECDFNGPFTPNETTRESEKDRWNNDKLSLVTELQRKKNQRISDTHQRKLLL